MGVKCLKLEMQQCMLLVSLLNGREPVLHEILLCTGQRVFVGCRLCLDK